MIAIKQPMTYHKPALVDEVIEDLNLQEGGAYVDATFGGGGHSKAILNKLKDGQVLAFDQDKAAQQNLPEDDRFTFIHHNFRFLKRFLRYYEVIPVDGILADLGVASFQIDTPDKGFSTRYEGPLDMRMDKDLNITAQTIVNNYEQDELQQIFQGYGELPKSKTVARTIVQQRGQKKITQTQELVELLQPIFSKNKQSKRLAQAFQALRIEVNDEINALKELLEQSVEVLQEKGRIAIISYHSIEDRIVKHFFQKGTFNSSENTAMQNWRVEDSSPPLEPITKKPIRPKEEEVAKNPRVRSAKLRIAQKN